jgi:mannose-6-phosphate isomerase-like protein (cupin superfamily)
MERRDFLLKSSILSAFGLTLPFMSDAKTTNNSLQPVLLPSQPPLEHNNGMQIRVWVRSSMTNGLYSNVECAVAPKLMGPPPHYHKELDELMYVVEGTASVLVGDEVVEIQAGGWHLRPRLILHTFWNASDKPLRFYDMYFNQPFEEYLEQIFHELTPDKGYPEGSEKKKQRYDGVKRKIRAGFPR